VEGKISIISDLSKQLSLIDDDVAMSLYVKELSERINVDEKPILLRIREAKSQKSLIEPHRQVIGGNLRGQSDLKESSLLEQINQGFRQESKIIEMMLQFPEVMPEIRMYNVLNYFGNDELKSIGEIILKFEGQKSDLVSEVLKGIEDEKKKPIISKLAIGEEIWDIKGCRKLINQYILFNKNRKLQKAKNTREIKDAEKEENHESILRLLAEKQKKALQDKKQRESL
jgi:DNA primase